MTKQIPVRLSERDVSDLDALVRAGRFPTRSEALRRGLQLLVREERECEIEESYRRGYGQHPQEEWVGELGATLLGDQVAGEG